MCVTIVSRRGFLRTAGTVMLSLRPSGVRASARPNAREMTRRASEYVARYDEQLAAIVGEELYEQRSHVRIGQRPPGHVVRRTRSTIAWVRLPELEDTIAVREVVELDGRVVQQSPRLQQLLEAPQSQLAANVTALLNEGAAHNLAPGSRNINFPTFPLVYLRGNHAERSRWKADGREGAHAILSFEERRRPTIVRAERGDHLRGRGRVWIDESTGRIARAEIRIHGGGGAQQEEVSYQLKATFSADERLDIWLPERMEDVYAGSALDRQTHVTGEATYSNYRRFRTGGRLVSPTR